MAQNTKPEWVDNIIRALPEEMNEDEMTALILTVVSVYFVEPRYAIPVLMTAPLTYFRAAGLDLSILRKSYQSAAEGVDEIMRREANERRH
jgi:hypothetical protein